MDLFLLGWCWDDRVVFQKSASSTFSSQPIRGLRACGQQFPCGGSLVSVKQVRGEHQTLLSVRFREELRVLGLCWSVIKIVTSFQPSSSSLFLHIHIFLIINFWARLLRLRGGLMQVLWVHETETWGWGSYTQEGPEGPAPVHSLLLRLSPISQPSKPQMSPARRPTDTASQPLRPCSPGPPPAPPGLCYLPRPQ